MNNIDQTIIKEMEILDKIMTDEKSVPHKIIYAFIANQIQKTQYEIFIRGLITGILLAIIVNLMM